MLPYGAEAEEAQPTQHARVLTGRQARRAAYDAHVHRVRAGAASARDGGRPKGQSGRPMVAHGDFGMGGHLADEYGYEMGEGPYDDVPGVPDANGSPRRAVNPTRGEVRPWCHTWLECFGAVWCVRWFAATQ